MSTTEGTWRSEPRPLLRLAWTSTNRFQYPFSARMSTDKWGSFQ